MRGERKEEQVKVSGKEIHKVLERGPEFAFEKLQEFNNDVQTLTQRMSDLYHQDEETLMILSLFGVSVKVTVTAQIGEATPSLIGEYGVGSELSYKPKEDANGVQEQ